jgi:hypothetical protein
VSKIFRLKKPTYSPHEEAEIRGHDLLNLDVTECTQADIDTFWPPLSGPKPAVVRKERVVKLRATPPTSWRTV